MPGFCDSSQSQTNKYVDPLGPTNLAKGGTGAPQMRSDIFNYLSGFQPQMVAAGQNYASALERAASNPAWSSVASNASKTAAGNYLNGSVPLDREMAWQKAGTLADAANQNARIRSEYAKNGMSFGTASQQAEQANNASANAAAAKTSADTYLQNYLSERQNQNNAGQQVAQAQQVPLSYLSSVPGAYTSGLTPAANLISSLSSGGQMITSGGTYSPSLGANIMSGLGGL